MKKSKLSMLLSSLFLFAIMSVSAQKTITGSVSDSNGPLPGATITVEGTSTGTTSDFDGNFSISVGDGAILLVSYVGYQTQSVTVGNQSSIDVVLTSDGSLEEVIVVGYGSQREKEITSAVTKIKASEFNKGNISDASELLQGKVAGLSIYNRGGDPNTGATIRLRGISTVGANTSPLIVIDGIAGASLGNVDPSDIESMTVLKDGSAAAIYGTRGSSGVILVTTKKGSIGSMSYEYNSQLTASDAVKGIKIMTGDEFAAAGGTDLGSRTDWVGAVTQQGVSKNHNFSASGGFNKTSLRISANLREVEGILQKSGFDQFNTRLNLTSSALNDKLQINFTTAMTKREQQNGWQQALRYAVMYNPTAPIYGVDSPYPFNSEQFGSYFETLGLFDSFNPVSIIQQSMNEGKKTEFNYGLNLAYSIGDHITLYARIAQQQSNYANRVYHPTTANWNGNATSPLRKGMAELYDQDITFKSREFFATYSNQFGNTDLTVTGGYSYNQSNYMDKFLSLGDFPNDDLDFINAIEYSQDLLNAGLISANSNASPDEKVIAQFGRVNLTIDDAIFINASVRREGSTKLGEGNKWGVFPAFGVGADLNKYLNLDNVDLFKVRFGYGLTGALPGQSGLSVQGRNLSYDGGTGGVSTTLARAANPDLKWEEKAETNFGIEFKTGKLSATIDLYTRNIKDFILERTVDVAVYGVNRRTENAGELETKGWEAAIAYDVVDTPDFTWNTGLTLSGYETILLDYVLDAETRAGLGSPGQNGTNMIKVSKGAEIGLIWGPVFTGELNNGNPIFKDVNGDGVLVTGQDKALDPDVDFAVLGKGTPDLELGWSNQMTFGDWSVNAFFRGAFGHSLVNTFRAFYEPKLSTQSSYNYMNTSLMVDGLTTARFSSLYVEKADFIKLDNFTVARNFTFNEGSPIESVQVSLIARNPLVITNYTGTDPDPSLVDRGSASNGDIARGADVLSPGIDRRTNYFSSKSFTLGLSVKF